MQGLFKGSLTNNWFFKYKLYHIPFWCVYNFLWWIIASGTAVKAANLILFSPYSTKFVFYVVFQALGAYFNLYFLIPRYLEKGKLTQYTIYLFLSIAVVAAIIVSGYYVAALLSGLTFYELFKADPGDFSQFYFTNALPSAITSTALAMSIKLTKNWIQNARRQELLEKEKLETELKFLRMQFNPHFLFNTINSIFFLIHKNPLMASNSLAKFSDLLRYQLYECNEKQIPLSNELAYLENFIELEKLRQNNLDVSVAIDENPKHHLAIAPFVLMTFTENAFKHVSNHKNGPNWIKVHVSLQGNNFQFKISNSVSLLKSTEVVRFGGIGLANVRRRLELIYPGQYQLHIKNDPALYEVDLHLNLAEISETLAINQSA